MNAPDPATEAYREKLRSIGFMAGGRTRPRVRETRESDGTRTKVVTDEAGTVTEHTRRGTAVSHRQDVLVTPDTLVVKSALQGD